MAKELNVQNAHPRDERVRFDPDNHTYAIDGLSDGMTSVTTLLDEHFPKFDADAILDKHYNRWQQNPYKKPECYGKTKEEIKEMWKQSGEKAAAEGTRLHAAIESFYNHDGIEYDQNSKEWIYFLNFQKEHQLEPFRTEMVLWSDEHKLGGMVDFIVKNKDGTYAIYDWKRSKTPISKNEKHWGRMGSGPLHNLGDNKFNRYSLQLNLYRELLEIYYGYHISAMHVVRFHPDAKNFQLVTIDRMEKETEQLLKLRSGKVAKDSDTTSSLTERLEGLAL